MADKKTLTFALMDAPYEQARSTTALRLIGIAAQRGYDVNVFAYEGAVGLPFEKQRAHPNAVHGRDVDEEDHPLPHRWIAALMQEASQNGGKIDWVNCGLCVDECPPQAIFPEEDLPEEWQKFTQINSEWYQNQT